MKTRASQFAPWDGSEEPPLFSVNAGIDAEQAESVASIILAQLSERLVDVQVDERPLEGDEAFVWNLLLRTARALRTATGSAP